MQAVRYRATATSRQTVLIPEDVPRLAGGVWLYASTNRFVLAAENLTGRLAQIGTSFVPGSSRTWEPPIEAEAWADWLGRTRTLVGAVHRWVVALPLDLRRRRFNLLLLDRDGHDLAFAKFSGNPINELAVTAQQALTAIRPSGCWAPPLLDHGELAGWAYRVLGPMPQLSHRPARLTGIQRHAIVNEYQQIWRDAGVSRQALIHGDFGPWNVRRLRDGRVAVLDWEGIRTGAEAADEVWHALTARLVGRTTPGRAAVAALDELRHLMPEQLRDGVDDWLQRVDRDEPAEVDPGRVKTAKVLDFEERIITSLRLVRSRLD